MFYIQARLPVKLIVKSSLEASGMHKNAVIFKLFLKHFLRGLKKMY